ncbi:lysophospholipid acyltransferase family protein [Heliorestis acidaminivorans]|uniref:lysophospholipid acyltransferase family protein n=1 Tax=Heliorestis acidaminivorans TaxID=553427 RepID=UPI00147815C2|nr:lysophospholipid acyltransferase family protein [Heliorestis acidaminivorans]
MQDKDREEYQPHERPSALFRFFRPILFWFFAKICRWELKGFENVPQSGPVIIVSNHVSNWDPLIVGCAIQRPVHFMAKLELFQVPLLGTLLRNFGAYPVERGGSGRKALKRSIDLLGQNKVIGLFPEGTRSKTGKLGEAKAGVALIAAKAGAPIVPIGLYNSANVLSDRRSNPCIVSVGPPILIETAEGEKVTSQKLQEITDQIMNSIAEQIEKGRESRAF